MSFSKNDQRKVLLIDRDFMKQQLRAIALRNCEIEVHTASNIEDAGRLWTVHSYDLILLAAQENSEEAAALCSELKKSKTKQRIALLVGAPQYVREVGRKRRDAQPADTSLAPRLVIGHPHTQPTHWHVMMERLFAAGGVS
jgi:response regulator RpfG family c-di-GMP phosphodiesterase